MKFLKPILFFLLIIFLIVIIFFAPELIRIKSISCVSQYGSCGDEITGKINENVSETLSSVSKRITKTLTEEPIVKNFSLQYKFPDRLLVNLILNKPMFALKNSSEQNLALISREGKVLLIQDSTNLPCVVITEKLPNVSENIKNSQLFALSMLYNMYTSYQVKTGTIEGDSLVVEIPPGLTVIFPLRGDISVLMGSLILINQRLNVVSKESKINNIERVKVIDLRYKNPVLK